MDLVPLGIGAVVGLADGTIMVTPSLAKYKYAHTTFRLGVLALGVYGETWGNWNPDVSYGLMTSALAMLGTRLPTVMAHGVSSAGDVVVASGYGGGAPVPPRALLAPPACAPCAAAKLNAAGLAGTQALGRVA